MEAPADAFNRETPMICAFLLTLLVPQEAASAVQYALVHREDDKVVAKATLELAGRHVRGMISRDESRVEGHVLVDAAGAVTSYERIVRASSRVVSRVKVVRTGTGYRVREEGPLGGRTRLVTCDPVHAVLDGGWPEALLPVLMTRAPGSVRLLELPAGRHRAVELRARERGARFLDVPGGGLTLTVRKDRSFDRLVLPGSRNPDIIRADHPPTRLPETIREVQMQVAGQAVQLSGTLTLPARAVGPVPGVVVLADAGNRDRNGNAEGVRSDLLADLARDLAREGFGVLRYDKRDLSGPAASWRALRQDARAAAIALGARSEIDARSLFVIGHGEGGLLAAEVATDRPDLFRGVAVLGMPARPLSAVLEKRLLRDLGRRGASPAEVETALDKLREELHQLSLQPADASLPTQKRMIRDLLRIDPVNLIRGLTCPVFVVYGDKDVEVPSGDPSAFRSAVASPNGSVRVQVLGDADHEFRQTLGGAVAPAADVARPRHPALIPFLRGFLRQVLAAKAGGK